jgi:predicted Zn-dependent peptidase
MASASNINDFYIQNMLPARYTLAIVGNFDLKETNTIVNKIFSTLPHPARILKKLKPPISLLNNIDKEYRMDIKQGHLFIGFHAPAEFDRDYLAFNLLIKIIGQGNDPLLNRFLRKKRYFNHKVSTQYFARVSGGALIVHIIGEPGYLRTIGNLIIKFLNKTSKIGFSKNDYPLNIRHKISDLIVNLKNTMDIKNNRAIEKDSNIADFLATRLMYSEIPEPGELYTERLNNIKSKNLKKMASKYLIGCKHVIITIIPENKDE